MGDLDAPTHPRPIRRTRVGRAALMAAGILAVGVTFAACGGGSPTPGAATGSTGGSSHGTQGTGLLAYASCMRSHGVPNFPDPDGSGGIPKQALINALQAVSSSQAKAAQNACNNLMPAGGLSGQPAETITAQDQQDYLKAASCLRSHGFPNFPDPTFSGGTVHFDVPSSIDTQSAKFMHAQQICQQLIPAGLPDSGRSGG